MRSKRLFSSGGVIFRKSSRGSEVALIARAGGKVWCLPKGLVEKGEAPRQTALREVQEETGLAGRVIRKIGDIHYRYASQEEKTLFSKKVSFFLMERLGGKITDHDFEVDQVKWFSWDRALKKLSYPTERELLRKAKRLLNETG